MKDGWQKVDSFDDLREVVEERYHMQTNHTQNPREKAVALARHRSRKAPQIAELAAQAAEIKRELLEIERMDAVEAEKAVMQAIVEGSLKIKDLVSDIDVIALAESTGSGRSAKRLLKALSVPAVQRVGVALMSPDERTSLAAAKIVIDADDGPTADAKDEAKELSEDDEKLLQDYYATLK